MEVRIKNFKVIENYKEDTSMLGVFEVINNTSSNDRNVIEDKWEKEVKVGMENIYSNVPVDFFISVMNGLKREQNEVGKFSVAEVCRKIQRESYPEMAEERATSMSKGIREYLKALEIIIPINKSRIYKISDYDRIEKLIRNPFITETKEWAA